MPKNYSLALNWTIHGREIQLFLVTVWCCLPVNYLLSSLCNWFRLVPDLFKPVLHIILLLIVIGMYLHGFEKCILPDINKQSSPGERWESAEA